MRKTVAAKSSKKKAKTAAVGKMGGGVIKDGVEELNYELKKLEKGRAERILKLFILPESQLGKRKPIVGDNKM